MKDQITNYVRAGYPGIYIVSFEEARVEAVLRQVADTVKTEGDKPFGMFAWSLTSGIIDYRKGEILAETQDPMTMLDAFNNMEDGVILAARDFHMVLEERNPILYRKLKDVLREAKSHNRVFVAVGCQLKLPVELEKELVVVEFALPGREQLGEVLDGVAQASKAKLNGKVENIIDAASGLTTAEAENAFALSVVEHGDITPRSVYREKCATVKKNGLLEVVETDTTLDDVGGLENLKADLFAKRNLFTKAARAYGLPSPRGLLAVGQPGTGKSLISKATGNIFGLPLLRLEAGKLFGSLVGQSEQNWRTAFATAKAISPCVLWVDEVEGLFSGTQSSGQTDGGTTNRVVKAILQDLQDHCDGIFPVFTANDIDGCPDPLIDRVDVWSVDLPNQSERESIWRIHIAKRKRDPKKFDIAKLAKMTDGFSGRQIEQVWLKAMIVGFNDGGREPMTKDCEEVAAKVVPTSVTMAEAIERRRKRLANRAQPASAVEVVRVTAGPRKLAK